MIVKVVTRKGPPGLRYVLPGKDRCMHCRLKDSSKLGYRMKINSEIDKEKWWCGKYVCEVPFNHVCDSYDG